MNKKLFHRRDTYSSLALLLVLIAEAYIICRLKEFSLDFTIPIVLVGIIVLLAVIGRLYAHHEFWPQSTIFTKLMANAIAPTRLGAFYLLFFIIHLGWITDGSFNLFKSDNYDTDDVLISLCTGCIGLFILICFFPEGKVDKSKAKRVVLVSGISKLSIKKVTLNDNGIDTEVGIISLFNLVPLVRFFNLIFKSNQIGQQDVKKLLILSSDVHYAKDFFANAVVDITSLMRHDGTQNPLFNKERIKKYTDASGQVFYAYYVLPSHDKGIIFEGSHKETENVLRTIIKSAALQEYPDQSDFINSLQIEFTSSCNYDDFGHCFQNLSEAIEKEDNNQQRLYFNLTPGTGIVGSLMTLFSIDKDRELYFYAQNSSKELLPVDKSKLPLENLLSQALEKIKEQKKEQ